MAASGANESDSENETNDSSMQADSMEKNLNLEINKMPVDNRNALIDSGSRVTLIRKSVYDKINHVQLFPLNTTLRGFSNSKFTCRNCGGGDRGRVAIYRPFGEVSLSLNRTVTCMVLNDRRTSCPCHDEFRGPRSDYVRQTRCCHQTVGSLQAIAKRENVDSLVVEIQFADKSV
ncbi:uncharacterized protein TNCV_2921931 [Trichonephila clavipes]|nr:uncharacterized protein TNCV_2921931 [Trichonephila clavipes]